MAALELTCFKCGYRQEVIDRVGRRDECDKCGEDLHVCKNCQHYDPAFYNSCKESSADVIQEKERANFCDYFQPGGQTYLQDERQKQLAAAEALFKKK